MKHLEVLRSVDLVITREDGRKRINSINAVPIRMIYERWVSGFEDLWASKLIDIKQDVESEEPMRVSKRRRKTDFGWKRYEKE